MGFLSTIMPKIIELEDQGFFDKKLNPDTKDKLDLELGASMKKGGMIKTKKMSSGSTASKRADGCAQRGKTKGKMC